MNEPWISNMGMVGGILDSLLLPLQLRYFLKDTFLFEKIIKAVSFILIHNQPPILW